MEPKYYLPILELKNLDDFVSRAHEVIYYEIDDFREPIVTSNVSSYKTYFRYYLTAINKDKDIVITYLTNFLCTEVILREENFINKDFSAVFFIANFTKLKELLSKSYLRLQCKEHSYLEGVLKNTN